MKILIAEDDPVSRRMLELMLGRWGYQTIMTCDGDEAWLELQKTDAPSLAILDWMMPAIDGLELCRKVKRLADSPPRYLILLTAKARREDIAAGLEAGADDYLTKPFDYVELRARLGVGERILRLQKSLTDRVQELEEALSRVKQLQGLLPICSYCKRIRDDQNYWRQVENYISEHSDAQFSHSICPECYTHVVEPELERWESKKID